jgi:hypothetical protein
VAYAKEDAHLAADSPRAAFIEDLKKDDFQLYGQISRCVDYFLFPEKIFAFGWRSRDRGRYVDVGENVFPDSKSSASLTALVKSCEGSLAYFQASHGNHAHFQYDLLASLRTYHTLAIAVANDEEEDDVFAGLMINAIADHYLQDLFAPGHVVTARDRLTDLPATAVHDLANNLGAIFRPDPAFVTPFLAFLCGTTAASLDSQGGAACKGRGRNGVFDSLKIVDPVTAIDQILKRKTVVVRGDGHLMDPRQEAQRLLLLAVEMRSILDVILPPRANHFRKLDFHYYDRTGHAVVRTPFGEYDFSQDGQRVADAVLAPPPDEEAERLKTVKEGPQFSVFSLCVFGGCESKLYKVRTRSAIFSGSFHRESQSAGDHDARNVYSLEFSNFSSLLQLDKLSRGYISAVEFSPTVGYSYYRQGSRSGSGPFLRFPIHIPETEFAVGPYIRWLRYYKDDEPVRRLSHGMRMDAGFTTYATFFIGFGFDYSNHLSGSLKRSTMWSAGLRIGAPLTRLQFGQ